jgi:hypothetical protein
VSVVWIRADVRIDHERLARHIAAALRPARGERVILRSDPATLPALTAATRQALEAAGAVVEVLSYSRLGDFAKRLGRAQVYVSMPTSVPIVPEEAAELDLWLERAAGRQLHFGWQEGTRDEDGEPAAHDDVFDRLYAEALDIDYAALGVRMDRVMAQFRAGLVRVSTPQGTDLQFRAGDRPFTTQDGDASAARAERARVRAGKRIDLPAGALEIAPIESTVYGTLVVPRARLTGFTATNLRFIFSRGRALEVSCCSSPTPADPVSQPPLISLAQQYLDGVPFRAFALGVNPKLTRLACDARVPYYGYGAGMVQLSIGDNSDLGGSVRGGPVRTFYFPEATVTADGVVLVRNGVLQ